MYDSLKYVGKQIKQYRFGHQKALFNFKSTYFGQGLVLLLLNDPRINKGTFIYNLVKSSFTTHLPLTIFTKYHKPIELCNGPFLKD